MKRTMYFFLLIIMKTNAKFCYFSYFDEKLVNCFVVLIPRGFSFKERPAEFNFSSFIYHYFFLMLFMLYIFAC